MKARSRVIVGFHRLGVVLAAPFLLGAVALAVLQWQNPTGPLLMDMPVGTRAWGFGDDLDGTAKEIIEDQRRAGFQSPSGMMVVGLPLGNVRHENADWTNFQLADGREIGIAQTGSNNPDETARKFLLMEKKVGRYFTDKDQPVNVDGVQVIYLNIFSQFPPAQSPWLHQHRDWTWPLVAFCTALAAYTIMLSIAWIIDGFTRSRPST